MIESKKGSQQVTAVYSSSEHNQQRRLRTICAPVKGEACVPVSGQNRLSSNMRRLCEPAPLGSRVPVFLCRQIAVYGKRRRWRCWL